VQEMMMAHKGRNTLLPNWPTFASQAIVHWLIVHWFVVDGLLNPLPVSTTTGASRSLT